MHKVLVLLSTYNGENFLEDQLESLSIQEEVEVNLLVRDDGSVDNTLKILDQYRDKFNYYHLIKGQNKGAKESFFELLANAKGYNYYAFCDQDDVWKSNKLKAAIKKLDVYENEPALYLGNYIPVDLSLNRLTSSSHTQTDLYLFNEILVKNHIIGCTMVFNQQLLSIHQKCQKLNVQNLPYHDHWLYILCSSVNGKLLIDKNSYILYRQHDNNTVGERNIWSKIKKNALFSNNNTRYKYLYELLKNYGDMIPIENKSLLNKFIDYQKNPKLRFFLFFHNPLSAPNFFEQFLLNLSLLLGKF